MVKEYIKKELDISIADKELDKSYIEKLNKNESKVKYLRIVKDYTQAETAEIIGISTRQVQRIEKKIRNN